MLESNKFSIGDIELDYVPLIGSWIKGSYEFQIESINVFQFDENYILPNDFISFQKEQLEKDEVKCRLVSYDFDSTMNTLHLSFSKVYYSDYLLVYRTINKINNENPTDFRLKYIANPDMWKFLPNIAGVGIFLITADDKIILTKRNNKVILNPAMYGYSASGTMDWNGCLNPFKEIERECLEELNHKIDIKNTFLISFGFELNKLYYQFSFVEFTKLTSNQIIDNCKYAIDFNNENTEIISIPYLSDNIYSLLNFDIETISKSILIQLISKKFDLIELKKCFTVDKLFNKETLLEEWNKRANRIGRYSVLSSRFPENKIDKIGVEYEKNVLEFIDNEYELKKVIEIGCGAGYFTQHYVLKANKLVCIDISDKMIEINKNKVGENSKKIEYHQVFFEDYKPDDIYDIGICSLILTHIVSDENYDSFITKLKQISKTLFIFEPIDSSQHASKYAKPRDLNFLLQKFEGWNVIKSKEYMLFNDKLIFLKMLIRKLHQKKKIVILAGINKNNSDEIIRFL
jgi:2-polyprenyl-3-methyl-5-hydroxy-6-metoxy-1,4-benzoquinol methylase